MVYVCPVFLLDCFPPSSTFPNILYLEASVSLEERYALPQEIQANSSGHRDVGYEEDSVV